MVVDIMVPSLCVMRSHKAADFFCDLSLLRKPRDLVLEGGELTLKQH
jgi:hypothetical protein